MLGITSEFAKCAKFFPKCMGAYILVFFLCTCNRSLNQIFFPLNRISIPLHEWRKWKKLHLTSVSIYQLLSADHVLKTSRGDVHLTSPRMHLQWLWLIVWLNNSLTFRLIIIQHKGVKCIHNASVLNICSRSATPGQVFVFFLSPSREILR
jgi:hypothetical protein